MNTPRPTGTLTLEQATEKALKEAARFNVAIQTGTVLEVGETVFDKQLKLSVPVLVRPGVLLYGIRVVFDIDTRQYYTFPDESPYFLSYTIAPFIHEAVAAQEIVLSPEMVDRITTAN